MDYTELPDDILEKIVRDHLPTFSDRIQFSQVCKSWNSFTLRRRRRQPLPGLLSRLQKDTGVYPSLPMLQKDAGVYPFLPISMMEFRPHYFYDEDNSYCKEAYDYFKEGNDTVCPCRGCETDDDDAEWQPREMLLGTGRRPIEMLPRATFPIVQSSRWSKAYQRRELEAKHFVASFHGWLLLITYPLSTSSRRCRQLQHQLHLFNPITHAMITLLPHPPTLEKLLSSGGDIIKAVLSSSPDNVHVDCHAIVLSGSSPYLAWCKVLGKGRSWKLLSDEIFETQPKDVSYYGETLYVMDSNNVYVVRDLIVTSSDREPSVRAVSLSSILVKDYPSSYTFSLAPDLAGQLLVICSFRESKEVHKLVVSSSSGEYKWEKMRSLDGYALFLGTNNQSFCLPASDDDDGVIANRIYFPSGVFNLEFGCFAPFADPYGYKNVIKKGYFWFLPMPRDVIGEHMKLEKGVGMRNGKLKGFSYWTDQCYEEEERIADSKASFNRDMKNNMNRFQALLSTDDDDTADTNG